MGIGTMARGEKGVIYVKSQYLTQSPFMPVVEGLEEVYFDVELVHFVQVCEVLLQIIFFLFFHCNQSFQDFCCQNMISLA